jgi:hypothetical protein
MEILLALDQAILLDLAVVPDMEILLDLAVAPDMEIPLALDQAILQAVVILIRVLTNS